MKKFLRLISIICIIALFAGCGLIGDNDNKGKGNSGKDKNKSEVVLTVNGVDYTLERYNLYYYNAQDIILSEAGYTEEVNIPKDFWNQKVDGKTNLERAKDMALEDLVYDALSYQKAKELGIKLTAEEKSAISNQMSALRQDNMSFEQFKNIGIGEDELEKYYTEYYHLTHLLPKLIEKGELEVDEKAAEAELNSQYVKAQHILISTVDSNTGAPYSDDKKAEAKKKTQDILNKINAGGDFEKLMLENTEDPGTQSAPDGYVFTTGQMVPQFEEAAYALSVGQVSGLVETDYGYHIIKRVPLDVKGEQETAVLESIMSNLVMPDYEELVKVMKSKAKITTNDKVIKALEPSIGKK